MPMALKDHPFAVVAHFDSSLVFTYAVPVADVANLLPPCLELDTLDAKWAFVAVAMVQTRQLRPAMLPSFIGSSFYLLGYRLFVRYTTAAGKRLRGLYILRSETDSRLMNALGGVFTHYDYHYTDIHRELATGVERITSVRSGIDVQVADGGQNTSLPFGSPFNDWKEARRFAGPLPFTFSYLPASGEVVIVQGVREHWTPSPVQVVHSHIGFLDQAPFRNAVLASAFSISDIPYRWEKGYRDKWNG
ncbi:MAG: DUF2071 domain-containing protein [Taibaiella sp.]|nr:DUF2071 domain-containing protein [Taibaiella sp.]